MKNKIHIADLKKERVFRVPEGYFQTLPILIQQKINEYLIGQENNFPREQIFLIPEHYFERLPEEIQQKIAAFRAKSLPLHQKTHVFNTPDDYFETLSQKIQAKINESPKKTSLVYLPRGQWAYTLSAALVLILVLIGGIKIWNTQPKQDHEIVENNKPAETDSLKDTPIQPKEEKLQTITLNQSVEKPTHLNPKNLTNPKNPSKENEHPSQVAYQALKELPKEAIEAYLQNLPHSQEEIVETLLETEQAASVNLLPDLLLESEMDDLLEGVSDQDLKELDRLLDTKKIKKSEK